MRDYKLRKRVYNSFVDGEKLEKKTSAMTTPVGVDEEGKLWTSGGGGGSGTTCYKISFEYGTGWDSGLFKLNVTAPFTMEVVNTQGIALLIEKNGTATFNVEWDEDTMGEPFYEGYPLANTFIYAKEYTTTDYSGNAEHDPISKYITVTEVTL